MAVKLRRFQLQGACDVFLRCIGAIYWTDVEGDFAEFGCMSGDTTEIIAQAAALIEGENAKATLRPKLHVFDSFEGLPEPDDAVDRESPAVMSGRWKKGTCAYGSPHKVLARVEWHLPGRCVIHKGWFKDTLPEFREPVALAHIDCDLYSSTKEVLDHLFGAKLLVPGARVLFDEWDEGRADPNMGERRAWWEATRKYQVHHSDHMSYGLTGKSFIVHGY